MRTSAPRLLPLFRSEMQVELLALLLLQPEREWTMRELAATLDTPVSSVHRELLRAVDTGVVSRTLSSRPHTFHAEEADPLYPALRTLLDRSVGVEDELRAALSDLNVVAAVIHGSWVDGPRHADSDIDVLVVGEVSLPELRRRVRPLGKRVGRTIDLTVFTPQEFQRLTSERSSFGRKVLELPTTQLIGDLGSLAQDD